MAVIPRKRAGGTVYGVVTSYRGKKYWELVGANRREADSVDAKRKREAKAGTFQPVSDVTDAASVKTFAERWLDARRNRSADNDRALITRHVLSVRWFSEMRIGDVRYRHVKQLHREIEGGKLSPKSVSLVMGLVSIMFRVAVEDEVIGQTPYLIPRGTLKRAGVKRFPYTVAEASALMLPCVGDREMIWNSLAFFTGARCGEICGLRWGDWDEAPVPLGALVIERQYSGEVLKTERPRIVPVHPALAAALRWWRNRWSFYFLSTPGPEDLIVPRHGHEHAPISMTKSSAYKAWLRSCKAAGVTNRSVHSTRHTFITVARRNGADKEAVELVTHNPKGTIVDRYTTREWAELCAAVACVSYDPPALIGDGSVDGRSLTSAIDGSRAWTRTSGSSRNIGESADDRENSPARASLVLPSATKSDAGVDARQPDSFPRSANALRLERLALVAQVDPGAAAPGLAACNGLDAALSGDLAGAVELLRKEALRA